MLQRSAPQTVPYLGAIERSPQLEISSRHLGLRQACEIEDLERKLQFACERIEPLLNCLPTEQIAFSPAKPVKLPALLKGIRIAIARDLAFSFIYRRNLEVLSGLGADITFFSPLEDSVLPDCDSIYLPGGYPELHLARLCANVSMKESIKNHFQKGQRIYAECGGMLYLLERLVDKTGTSADMVGLIPGEATMGKSLTRLAYQYLESGDNKIHGHTFHYSISEIETVPCSQALHPFDKTAGEPAYRIDGLWASYVHLYFDSNPLVAASFFTAHTN
jgi:cobyrinic acid a,c-diamide synthase